MKIEERIASFVQLGERLKTAIDHNNDLFQVAKSKNGWFGVEQSKQAFKNWAEMLTINNLNQWIADYPPIGNEREGKRVGIIMAGNIPLVGLHDLLAVLLSGNIAVVKPATDDSVLIRFVIDQLYEINEVFKDKIDLAEKLTEIDAVIATGSNNSSRYFEAYFGKYPHIIRKSRTSVAILEGNESTDELKKLGEDIFTYFGLGCRNVTKLYVPKGYKFDRFFESIIDFSWVLDNIKYTHNYDYHKTLFLLNNEKMLDNEFVLVKEETKLKSPIGVIHYEYYDGEKNDLIIDLQLSEEVQCVVDNESIKYGEAQSPRLWNYADNVDTLSFLLNL